MSTRFYLISAFILLLAAFVIFRVVIRRDYLHKGRLSLFSSLLEWLIFSSWGFFVYFDLTLSRIKPVANPVVRGFGWMVLVAGLSFLFIGMIMLGIRRSHGLEVDVLKSTGLYGITRNPQVLAGSIAVMGGTLIWPSWHSLGWLVIFMVMVHIMVLTEEEHLLDSYGEKYKKYCRRVPRYIGGSPSGR